MAGPVGLPFHAVIDFGAARVPVLDFGQRRLDDAEVAAHRFAIGRYDEDRPHAYPSALFQAPPEGGAPRTVHVGIDLFAPLGTAVHAFADGIVHRFGYNPADGDYGATVITAHDVGGATLYALHGHLSRRSLEGKREGIAVRAGEVIAWLGDRSENGGWVPHLHFQLSFERPERADLPGVVTEVDRPWALLKYPDPRLVLGPLY